jgi:hypothetical protein
MAPSIAPDRRLSVDRNIKGRANAAPPNLTSFPKLLAADVDDTMNAHKSYELAQALASYSAKMASLEDELGKLKQEDKSFQGYSSHDVAAAFLDYAKAHHQEGLPADFVKMTNNSMVTEPHINTLASTSVLLSPGAYSWTALLMQMQWARVIYCIVWVTSGLLLIFFGYASFFWLNKIEAKSQRKQGQQKTRILSGGVGGLMIGFLFFSYLTSVIHNTLCVDQGKKALSAGAFFAVWLAPGLIGAILGGHFYFMAKVMTAVLGGTSLTIILTAMFGIQTILVRAILLVVIVTLFTAPLLASRINVVQKLVINACTSLAGVATLLNGVALFAPPYEASADWIDLWTMLFCSNTSASKTDITAGWGTSAFKGYIAGALIGAAIGFAFELFLHRQSGNDADSDWNQYLGTYTQQAEMMTSRDSKSGLDLATSMGAAARAGLFEPAPTAWQRMVDYFDSNAAKSPAQYGNLSRDGTLNGGGSLTEKVRRKRSTRSVKGSSSRPARFQALSNRDDFDDQESECSFGKDEKDFDSDDEDKHETRDLLSSLSNEGKRSTSPHLGNYHGHYALPRLPILATSTASTNTSQLSGTTAINSDLAQEKSPSSSSLVPPAAGIASVPATPSLINAITRIQAAQEAARSWQKERNDTPPYNGKPE